jgi:hypothetical protein
MLLRDPRFKIRAPRPKIATQVKYWERALLD